MNTVQNYKREYQISQWLPSPAAPVHQVTPMFSYRICTSTPEVSRYYTTVHLINLLKYIHAYSAVKLAGEHFLVNLVQK